MKLKSFFAGSVQAALGMAREELGAEALLVNSRKSPPEAKHLGEYEVVAALMPGDATPAAPAPAGTGGRRKARGTTAAVAAGRDDLLCREVAELRRQMQRMRKAIWQSGLVRLQRAPGTEVLPLLLEAEIEPQLAQEIAACVEARLSGDPLLKEATTPAPRIVSPSTDPGGEERLRQLLRAELERRFSVESELGRDGAQPRIVALVGPPGVGKTATLAKLAVICGLKCRRSVQLLSMDTCRIAAGEPLRTYASILGVGFQLLATALALEQALKKRQHKDLILIDTPGFSPRDRNAAADLAACFARCPEIDIHLTLPATTKSADLTSAVDRFEIFRPSKLLFTRVDEASSFGPAFSEAVRTAKPISFLATGQQVPEDLEAAVKARVIELVLQRDSD